MMTEDCFAIPPLRDERDEKIKRLERSIATLQRERDEAVAAWRDLATRAWQVLDVELPNEGITAELFAALSGDTPNG